MNRNTLIIIGVIVAIVFSGLTYFGTPEAIVGSQGPEGPQGPVGPVGPVGPRGPQGPSGTSLGAVSGPISPYAYMGYGGVTYWAAARTSLLTASSTVCYLRAPAATSTLVSGAITFTLASTSAVTVDMARSSNQYSTSTMIGTGYAIGASAQASIVASSTDSATTIFAPNEYFVFRFQQFSSSNGALNAPTGRCSAVWREI